MRLNDFEIVSHSFDLHHTSSYLLLLSKSSGIFFYILCHNLDSKSYKADVLSCTYHLLLYLWLTMSTMSSLLFFPGIKMGFCGVKSKWWYLNVFFRTFYAPFKLKIKREKYGDCENNRVRGTWGKCDHMSYYMAL